MTDSDFERRWQKKFRSALKEIAGTAKPGDILTGDTGLSNQSSPGEIIDWTRRALERMEQSLPIEKQQQVMTDCACHYPAEELQPIADYYQVTADLTGAHRLLQEQFVSFLQDIMQLTSDQIDEILARGWGVAGIIDGDRIIATKIPKSSNLSVYLIETDPEKRRRLYCHCPRIREIIATNKTLSPIYCYCGAGFYQNIWETILGKPVRVELLKSVLQGDDICQIAVYLK